MVTEIASRRASTGRGRDAAPTNADPGGPGTGDRRAGTGTRPGRRGADAAGTLDSADHGEDHGHSEWDAGSTSRRGLHVAQMEARVCLEEALRRMPDWEVDWSDSERLRTEFVQGFARLAVTFAPR